MNRLTKLRICVIPFLYGACMGHGVYWGYYNNIYIMGLCIVGLLVPFIYLLFQIYELTKLIKSIEDSWCYK